MKTRCWSRHEILAAGLALTAATRIAITAEHENMMSKRIPRSGESLPVVGLGTYNVFDVASTPTEIELRRKIVDLLTQNGGSLLDTAGAHDALAGEMERFKPDFIQINYSLGEREAENRLLPTARDLGVAVLINRPFQTGTMFRAVSSIELPVWAREFASSWGQFFLKFIISHPAVTCVIPATSKTQHMIDNLGAGMGILPDKAMRKRMSDFFTSI